MKLVARKCSDAPTKPSLTVVNFSRFLLGQDGVRDSFMIRVRLRVRVGEFFMELDLVSERGFKKIVLMGPNSSD